MSTLDLENRLNQDFDFVVCIDTVNKTEKFYYARQEMKDYLGWDGTGTIRDYVEIVCEKCLDPADWEFVKERFTKENILKELKDKDVYCIPARRIDLGTVVECDGELSVMERGRDGKIVIGFKNDSKSALVRNRQRYVELITALTDNYENVFYVNLKDDSYVSIHLGGEYNKLDAVLNGDDFFNMTLVNGKKVVHEEDFPAFAKFFERDNVLEAVKNGRTYSPIHRLDFGGRWVYYRELLLYSETDSDHLIIASENIDAAHRAQLAHESEEERKKRTMELLTSDYEAVFLIDSYTGAIEILRVTDEFAKLAPPLEEGMDFPTYVELCKDYIEYEFRQSFVEALSDENLLREFSANRVFFYEYRATNNGNPLWYRLKITYTGDWEKDHCFLVAVINIDKMVRAQQEEKKKLEEAFAEAERVTRAKSDFILNMSHDLRTPLSSIMSFLDMAALTHCPDNDDEFKERIESCPGKSRMDEYILKAKVCSFHLNQLVKDLIDLAMIERGGVTLEKNPLKVRDCIDNVLVMLQPEQEAAKLDFSVDIDSVSEEYVFADGLRLEQILMNIISNALKYTGEGGKVTFKAEEFPGKEDKEQFITYRFIVTDNGIGMSEDFLAHIFELPGTDRALKNNASGTGFGLAIVKSLVDAMGGSINISSVLHEGTTVILEFSFRIGIDEEVVKADESEVRRDEFEGMTVLLVEDNMINREIAREILTEMGIKVYEAVDGADAVEKVKTLPRGIPDLVFMDIQMPMMDGFEATRAIRALESDEKATVPIVAMTASGTKEDKDKAIESGMDDYLVKPIELNKLLAVIERFC